MTIRSTITGPYKRQRRRRHRATLIRGPLLARILRKLGALLGVS